METLILLWTKWTGMVKIKHKDFIDPVPIMPCQNSFWIMGLGIYDGRTQIPWVHPLWQVFRQGSTIGRLNNYIKIANNTKINHIMVSFTDYFNVVSIDRLPSKNKIRKDWWYFDNSLLCKPKSSSATKTFRF